MKFRYKASVKAQVILSIGHDVKA